MKFPNEADELTVKGNEIKSKELIFKCGRRAFKVIISKKFVR